MAKTKGLFYKLRKLFISECSRPGRNEHRRRWVFRSLRVKRFASFSSSYPASEIAVGEPEEEQRNHVPTAAREPNAASYGAEAREQIAEEDVRITTTPESTHHCWEDFQELPVINISCKVQRTTNHQYKHAIKDLAAITIQSAFRGHLARKALRALKGLVRFQAIIRGRAVRRQTMTTLRCLQSIVNIQSQVCESRFRMDDGTLNSQEKKELNLNQKDIKIDPNCQRRWDDSLLTKEEAKAQVLSKKEAIVKRERIKEYALSHRRSIESEQNKANEKRRYWLEPWVEIQLAKKEEDFKISEPVNYSHSRIREEFEGRELKARNFQKQHQSEVLNSPIIFASSPRRSFQHKKKHSIGGEGHCFVGSPVVPTYMSATESAIAKARRSMSERRSMGSPRLRAMDLDAYSEISSPYNHRLFPISSINSDVISSRSPRVGNPNGSFSQTSPARSNRGLRNITNYNSEY